MNRLLITAFAIGQAADVATWLVMDPAREMNPIVIGLGPAALLAKVCVCLFTAWVAVRYPSVAIKAVLAFGAALGLFGAWTNLP